MREEDVKDVLKNKIANQILRNIYQFDPLALIAWGADHYVSPGEHEELF